MVERLVRLAQGAQDLTEVEVAHLDTHCKYCERVIDVAKKLQSEEGIVTGTMSF